MSVFILFIYQFISRNNTEFIQVTGTKKAYPHRGFLYLGDAFLVPGCYGLSSTYVTIHGIGYPNPPLYYVYIPWMVTGIIETIGRGTLGYGMLSIGPIYGIVI